MTMPGWLAALAFALVAQAGVGAQVVPQAVESLPYAAVGDKAPASSELALALSPGGQMLAVSNGERVWLWRRAARERVAVTPARVPRQPGGAAEEEVRVAGMLWQPDATLLAWVALKNGGSIQAYAAGPQGARGQVLQAPPVPALDMAALAKRHRIPAGPDFVYAIHAGAQGVAWVENRGHGRLVLMAKAPSGKPRALAEGNWELESTPFDAQASRVFYATDKGIAVQAIPAGQAELIAGTRAGDRPFGFDPASRWLLLLRPDGGCDAAKAQGEHVCLLRLPAVASAGQAGAAAAGQGQPRPAAHAQPSFDCSQARSVTEQLLCERESLAGLDVQLAGLYRQALERSPNPGALRKQQGEWLRERDARCMAGKTLAQAREGLAADTCLREQYGQRMRLLRNQVAPDVGFTGLRAVPAPALKGTGFGRRGCDAPQAMFSDDGRALALEMHCAEAGGGRAFWLLDLQAGRAVAASPAALGPADPQAVSASMTGADLHWSGPVLTVFTSGKDPSAQANAAGQWLPVAFAASLDGPPKGVSLSLPQSLLARREAALAARKDAQATGDDGLIRQSALRLGNTLLWLSDQGRANIALRSRRDGVPGSAELHRGSWELLHLAHDQRQIVYPSDEGLMLLDAQSGVARRIRQTAIADTPLAWNPQTRQLAWASPRQCGMETGGNPLGPQLCVAVLDAVR